MAMTVQQIHPVAHFAFSPGSLTASGGRPRDRPPHPLHPAHQLSCGRGVEALVLAILDGHHALYKVGKRLEARGMLALLQPGLTRTAPRSMITAWARIEALFAANLNKVYSAVALNALGGLCHYHAWLHRDTTTIAWSIRRQTRPRSPRPGKLPAWP